MHMLLHTIKLVFFVFIQLALCFTVQAEMTKKNFEKIQNPTFEVDKTTNTAMIENNVNSIVIPTIKNAQHNTDLNTDSVIKKSKPSTPTLFMPHITKAENKYIPLMADAVIFANYDEELPAIVNYYTQASEEEIILFYHLAFA